MMKRILSILLVTLLAAMLFFGCGANDSEGENRRTTGSGTATQALEVTESLTESGKLGPLTKDIFAVYTAGGTYHVKYVGEMAGGGQTTTEIYAKDGNIVLVWPSGRQLIMDGFSYEVDDDQKTVTKTSIDAAGISYPIPPDPANMRFVGSGRADFMNEELDYDEYSVDENSRYPFQAFYFIKDGALKGIRHMADGYASDMKYLVFEKEVPNSVFDIPADYVVTG